MPVSIDQPVPYAPASAMLDLIERHRNKGLPPVVDADVLLRAGISDSLVPRTLQAMKTLDLLTEDGRPSEVFEGIRLAPTAEYQQRLTEWLNAAYADALSYVDPATDDEVAIRDAFRKYTPTGQQPRMVSLFMGLFTAAGVMSPRQKVSTPNPFAKPRQNVNKPVKAIKWKSVVAAKHASDVSNKPAHNTSVGTIPPALAGLLATLPNDTGMWTRERRDQFVTTFSAVLDYTFKIGNPPAPQTDNGDQPDD
jgi:Family of unknown function (DUF5343)